MVYYYDPTPGSSTDAQKIHLASTPVNMATDGSTLRVTIPPSGIATYRDGEATARPVAPSVAYLTQTAADARYEGIGIRVNEAPLSLTDPRVGAVLDGTGDQIAKVNTALGLLPSRGGKIYQPPGILRVLSGIVLSKSVQWEGAGDQASCIKAGPGLTGTLFQVSSSAPFSHVHDLQLDGSAVATKLLHVASARTRLSNLHINGGAGGAGSAGLWFHGVSSGASAHAAQVENVRVIDCGTYGVYLQGFSYDCEFVNLWVASCDVGIRAENTNGFFTNTHVWGCVGSGVELRDGNHLFQGCYVETCGGSGLNLFNAHRVKIANSNIWKNQGQGVSLATSDRCSVIGSNIYDNGGDGVRIADSLLAQIIGNTFYDDTSSTQTQDVAVRMTGTSDEAVIAGNVMRPADHASGASVLVGSSNRVVGNVGQADVGGVTPTPVDVQTFTASGTYTKPAGVSTVQVEAIGGGGGGGGGARRASGTLSTGGSGGSGGAATKVTLPAALVGATETVTVGTGGAGAAATTANDTNGAAGTGGGNSTFGTKVRAGGGGGGGGGSSTGASTVGSTGTGTHNGGTGATSSATGAAGSTGNSGAAAGGGSGGGIATTPANTAGGAGQGPSTTTGTTAGTAGTSGGGTGGNGSTSIAAGLPIGGPSGGGGGSSTTAAGGAGGNGAGYGSGGGGGGAALNGQNGGAGGAGQPGIVVVTSW
jgi:hypothetical protein